MRSYAVTILAVTLALPAAAAAQSGTMAAVAPRPAPQAAGTGERVWAGAVESKITTGRPYSAEAVTERTQVLADGNRISVSSLTRIFRDGEGRTRREMFNNDGTLRTISISDPVNRVSYTLDPVKKIAYRTANVMTPAVAPAATARYYESPERNEVGFIRTPAPAPAITASGGGGGRGGAAAAGGGGAVMMRTPAPDDPNTRKEDLAPQTIEGVMATGSRTTTVIPAGQIGNAQEIRVVSEQWFSDDLQVLVMTRHADPRSGENVYRLRNVLRAEPDPSLFAPPADYTVQDRNVRRPQ
jgi:hypothetical protein